MLSVNVSKEVASDGDDFEEYVKVASVDLSQPGNTCSFWVLVQTSADGPDKWHLANVMAFANDFIAIMQEAIESFVYQYGGGEPYPIQNKGTWDCATSTAMAWVSSYIRGVEQSTEGWQPGVTDFAALVSSSPYFLQTVFTQLLAVFEESTQQGLKVVPLLPGVAKGLGGTYAPPSAPTGCGFTEVGNGVESPIPPDKLEALLVGYEPGGASAEEGMSTSAKVAIGVGVAALAAVGLGMLVSKKRRS